MEFRAKQCILTKINALQHQRAHSLPPSPRNQCWNGQSPRRTRCALVDSNIDFGGRGVDGWYTIQIRGLQFWAMCSILTSIAQFSLVKVQKVCMETLDTRVCRSKNCRVLFSKYPSTSEIVHSSLEIVSRTLEINRRMLRCISVL